MNFISARWKKLSAQKKIYLVVGTMAFLIAGELIVLRYSMRQLSAVRAFVEGEALWSKAQKNALIDLKRYQRSKNEVIFEQFKKNLEVPAGDHIARLELLKPNPDINLIR